MYLHVPKESSGRTVNTVNHVYPRGMSNFNFPWLWSTEPASWQMRLQWAAHVYTSSSEESLLEGSSDLLS